MNERKNNAVILCAIEMWCVYQVWLLKQLFYSKKQQQDIRQKKKKNLKLLPNKA